MAFVRKRGNCNQLIETYREGGKVKQKVLADLARCTTAEEALEDARWWLVAGFARGRGHRPPYRP